MNKEEYMKRIKTLADKCMELNPEDPLQETWEVRDETITLTDAFLYSPRFTQGKLVMVADKTPGENLDDNLDNAIDSDICDAIESPYK